MAEKLSRMYGTEEDKVNCPFYFKIGSCRYENKCLRIHNRPSESQTVLIKHMYTSSATELALAQGNRVSEEEIKKALDTFEEFYEEVFLELANYGEIDDLIICDNIGDHMRGNVYVKYIKESSAAKCLNSLKNRYYDKVQLLPEFSPVTDFSNAICKQYIDGLCKRSGYCNYIHSKQISRSFKRSLFRQMYEEHPEYRNRSASKSRSKSRDEEKKHKKEKKKYSRSRSNKKSKKDHGGSKKKKHHSKKESKSGSYSMQKKTSEERRAEIDKWNNMQDSDEENNQNNNNNGNNGNNSNNGNNNNNGNNSNNGNNNVQGDDQRQLNKDQEDFQQNDNLKQFDNNNQLNSLAFLQQQ